MNKMQLIQMLRSGQSPAQISMSLLEGEMKNTPIGANLLELAKNKDGAAIEQVARNLAKAQGVDFDQAFTAFRQSIGL